MPDKGTQPNLNAEIVPLVTIDAFCRDNNIEHVDLIKIDAEGSDADVVDGAAETIESRGVWMVTIEGGSMCMGDDQWLMGDGLVERLNSYGFDCYANGQGVAMYRLTHCFHPRLCDIFKPPSPPQNSNVYCVSRIKAPELATLLLKSSAHQQAKHFKTKQEFMERYQEDA